MQPILRTLPILLLLGGCFDDGSLEGPQLLAPERVEFYWDASFNAFDDSLGALVPMDLMVYDGISGEAMGAVQLDISLSGGDGLIVLPDMIGFVDVEDCSDCEYLWDSYRDQYFVLPVGDTGLTSQMTLETDSTGLARVYVYVDAFSTEFPEFEELDVRIVMGAVVEHVVLVAE